MVLGVVFGPIPISQFCWLRATCLSPRCPGGWLLLPLTSRLSAVPLKTKPLLKARKNTKTYAAHIDYNGPRHKRPGLGLLIRHAHLSLITRPCLFRSARSSGTGDPSAEDTKPATVNRKPRPRWRHRAPSTLEKRPLNVESAGVCDQPPPAIAA